VLSPFRYWLCQFFGWGLFSLISIYLSYNQLGLESVKSDLVFCLLCIICTHLLRKFLLVPKWNSLPMEQLLVRLLPSILAMSLLLCFVYTSILRWSNFEAYKPGHQFFVGIYISCFMILTLWVVIYYIIHFVFNNRKLVIERLQMENNVKSLEIKNIKNNLQPHFIFNALNSIRALIDEDPNRARQGITQLSNILRSSIQVGKSDVVPMQKELEIVKDYLGLEAIRYEERLRVDLDIDDATLGLTFPPMMLQTLVENAVKHGIAAHENGGLIEIASKIIDDKHCVTVCNTGKYDPGFTNAEMSDGFGISSTLSRLQFIYGKESSILIQNIATNKVEVKINLPLKNNIQKAS
jgi:two-component system, LytTR family, sensor kinase